MKFNYDKLNGRIVEKFGSRRAFAEAFGVTENTLSRKLNHKVRITSADIIKMCSVDLLDIPTEQIHEYFFAV